MSQPVVHFEVIGKDPERLRTYFSELFGWKFDTPSPVAPEDLRTRKLRIPGSRHRRGRVGIEGRRRRPGLRSHAVFYVGVPDVEAALQRAEYLGRHSGDGPATSPNGLVIGHFTDPEGTLIGVAGVARPSRLIFGSSKR